MTIIKIIIKKEEEGWELGRKKTVNKEKEKRKTGGRKGGNSQHCQRYHKSSKDIP